MTRDSTSRCDIRYRTDSGANKATLCGLARIDIPKAGLADYQCVVLALALLVSLNILRLLLMMGPFP